MHKMTNSSMINTRCSDKPTVVPGVAVVSASLLLRSPRQCSSMRIPGTCWNGLRPQVEYYVFCGRLQPEAVPAGSRGEHICNCTIIVIHHSLRLACETKQSTHSSSKVQHSEVFKYLLKAKWTQGSNT